MITNPILPGFHPDPSILRIGDDYWIATSTFEWLPGICLHKSRDLRHWEPAGAVLTRPSQLDLRGVAPSKGVWAPDLSRDETGLCWMAYSVVRGITDNFFDLDNYAVTAASPEGPWSDPIYLNSSGFDPALYHENGRTWTVNLEWDFQPGHEHPGPIVLQEFSRAEQELIGEPVRVYKGGTDRGCLEGPRLFRRGAYYYLMAAEGGTGYGHAVTLARSASLADPWEADPAGPIVTSALDFSARGDPAYLKPEHYNPASPLQKSGHGALVETPKGQPYLVHLCSRPGTGLRCHLGRETAIQAMEWKDGWLRMAGGGNLAKLTVPEPDLPVVEAVPEPTRDDFDAGRFSDHWTSPRTWFGDDWVSWSRAGWVGLRGRESLFSTYRPSLAARRVQHWNFEAETRMVFAPRCYQQRAGLACVYDTNNFIFLYVSWSEEARAPYGGIFRAENGKWTDDPADRVPLTGSAETPVRLGLTARDERLQFAWARDGEPLRPIGPSFGQTALSDEACGGFTGAMVGLAAEDLATRTAWAWFDWFDYRPS